MSQKRIMIVEDEATTAGAMARALERAGYIITSMHPEGKRAFKSAIAEQPDIILMDIIIQGELDGIETAEQILAKADIPIIYITGYSDNEIMERANKTNPYGFLVKPIDFDEMEQTISAAIKKHGEQLKS